MASAAESETGAIFLNVQQDGMALGEDWAVCSGSRPDGSRAGIVAIATLPAKGIWVSTLLLGIDLLTLV